MILQRYVLACLFILLLLDELVFEFPPFLDLLICEVLCHILGSLESYDALDSLLLLFEGSCQQLQVRFDHLVASIHQDFFEC